MADLVGLLNPSGTLDVPAYTRSMHALAERIADYAEQTRIERIREQERLRSVKPMRWVSPQIVTPASTFIVGAAGGNPAIIDEGWTADVRVIAAKLSAADTLAAFVGENNNGWPLGQPTASAVTGLNLAVILIPKSSGIVNGGETIFLQTGGAGNITAVRITGWQAAGPEIAKLF